MRRILLLQKEPRLTPSSPARNNNTSDITSPVHLQISFTWSSAINVICNTPEKQNHPTVVSDHFSLPEHYIRDIELIPLQLINSDRDSIRNAREGLLITKGKTLAPYGWAAWVCVNLVQLLQTARKRMKGIKFTRQVGWPWAQFFEGRLSLTSG